VVASIGATEAIKFGLLAEKLGFDSLWITDHFIDTGGIKIEPWTVLGAIAAQTKKIQLGTAVTDPIRSHPAKTAHSVVTLDAISRGRIILGIGAGEAMNLIPFGLPFEDPTQRAERLCEAIQVIRSLWKSSGRKPVRFNGKFYHLKDAWLDVEIENAEPKIYVGALGGRRLLEIAGRMGDGWIPWLNTPETYRERLSIIRGAMKKAARDPKEVDDAAWIYTVLTDDAKEKKRALDHTKKALLVEVHTLKLLGLDLGGKIRIPYQNLLVDQGTDNGLAELRSAVPDEIALQCIAAGSPREVAETIVSFEKAGATHALIQFILPKDEQIRNFAAKVMPRLVGKG
jgi:phthiodiolone/phenolphthiodiolone dimycocerosates ketoreductase